LMCSSELVTSYKLITDAYMNAA